jgi:hypothetical protein
MSRFKRWLGLQGKGTWRYAVMLFAAIAPGVALAQVCTPTRACKPQFHYSGLNGLVPINDCKTTDTSSPCAWANVVLRASNFLACRLETTGPIALCYYSGVPGQPLHTPGCILSADKKSAQCDCYKISHNNPAGATYSYVDINSILNKIVYAETVAVCGADGSKCLNGANVTTTPTLKEAPVCLSIRNRTLFPGADVVSDFTPIPISAQIKPSSPYQCPTTGNSNVYAGCMTAPCRSTGRTDPTSGLPLVSCACPTYDGPNQVGNPQISQGGYSCTPNPYVWSSAYTPPTLPTTP